MHSKAENANHLDLDAQGNPSAIGAQPWWRGLGYNAISSAVLGEGTAKSSSLEQPNDNVGAKASRNEGDAVSKETKNTVAPQANGSGGSYGLEHQNMQHVASTLPSMMGEYLTSPAQLEIVGHSIACGAYPYSDPYCGGVVTAYGPHALVHPHLLGMHHKRMPLPLEMAEEPVYVNAKQYNGILRRRQSRAKAELEKKLIKVRKPYLHESRHRHAMRRARGCGGRFLNTKKLDTNASNPSSENGMGSGSTLSASSSVSEHLLHPNSTSNLNSAGGQQEAKEPLMNDLRKTKAYCNVNGNGDGYYQQHQGFSLSTYHSLSGERGEDGDCTGQQRGSILINRAPNRALTIQ